MKALFPISYGRACVSMRMAPLKYSTLTETSMSSPLMKPPVPGCLLEDEYSSLANLIEEGDVEISPQPPEAPTFDSLVERMRREVFPVKRRRTLVRPNIRLNS
jgi:hypothetical protein